MFAEYTPSQSLSQVVDALWTYSNHAEPEKFYVLPDNCADIIIDTSLRTVFISGVMSHFQQRGLKANTRLIGIRIKAEHFSKFAKLSAIQIRNHKIEFPEFLCFSKGFPFEALRASESFKDQINYLEGTFLEELGYLDNKEDYLVTDIADEIRHTNGISRLSSLSSLSNLSLRQLERRFKNQVGLTIKEFSAIVRLEFAKRKISNNYNASLLEIAFESGFYDHSHMGNEFKRIYGVNPSSFR